VVNDSEYTPLVALALMACQYLQRTDMDGILDNLAMNAGEIALEVLAAHSLVTLENSRFGR
jgi:hypothetical protein